MRNRKVFFIAVIFVVSIGCLLLSFLDVHWIGQSPQELEILGKQKRFSEILKEEGLLMSSDMQRRSTLLTKSFREASRLPGYDYLSEAEKDATVLTRILRNSGITSSLSEVEQRAKILNKLASKKKNHRTE